MADVQQYFTTFHNNIKLERFKENQTLREKRDIVLDVLDRELKALFAEREEPVPLYSTFNQGSYELDTGIKPIGGDYDIDVGVAFEVSCKDYPDPVDVKSWVYDALYGHTTKVEMRRPCVTVYYQRDGEDLYHVDLAIYSASSCNADGKQYLGKGKKNSDAAYRFWEESDPETLCSLIDGKHTGDEHSQFKRIIRYLKRWKCNKFSSSGHAAPTGIALTIACYNWFTPTYTVTDWVKGTRKYDDLSALKTVINAMLTSFQLVWDQDSNAYIERLKLLLPVAPYADLLDQMTANQMVDFKVKLTSLRDALVTAEREADPVNACTELNRQFGDDFPIPEKEETAQKTSPAFSHSSHSA